LLVYDITMCDCNLQDLSCDLTQLEQIFSESNPSVLILVSPLGLVPRMKEVVELCEKYDVILLEDVCESLGSKYQGQYLGSFGFASFFSMYFGHHLSTIEGGFINTNDEEFYHLLLMMRSHGWDRDLPSWKQNELREQYGCTDFDSLYNFYVPGMNLRSTDLQAFIGLRAIEKLDSYSVKRRDNFNYYVTNLNSNMLDLHEQNGDFVSSFAIPIVHKQRNNIIQDLMDADIEVRPLIAGDMSQKPMWTDKYQPGHDMPNCKMLNEFGFYVPNHQDLSVLDINKITQVINSYE